MEAPLNVILIIGAIIMAVVGFWVGYAALADKSKGGAIALGFLGAIIGAVLGVVGIALALALLIIGLILWILNNPL